MRMAMDPMVCTNIKLGVLVKDASSNQLVLTSKGLGELRWRSWFKYCATSQKVAGSIPDGVIGIFH